MGASWTCPWKRWSNGTTSSILWWVPPYLSPGFILSNVLSAQKRLKRSIAYRKVTFAFNYRTPKLQISIPKSQISTSCMRICEKSASTSSLGTKKMNWTVIPSLITWYTCTESVSDRRLNWVKSAPERLCQSSPSPPTMLKSASKTHLPFQETLRVTTLP